MTTTLPAGVRSYKRTATFTEATTPAALMSDHATKEGVWGLIHVEEGRLRYLVTDERRLASEIIITPESEPGIVDPTIAHRVEASAQPARGGSPIPGEYLRDAAVPGAFG